ncbi:MAG: sensor histidine kinase, partial [Candidatus Electrothrix sp. AX2]|nr:sensor histidine kinase [Candidatus Electrothrix gigas]
MCPSCFFTKEGNGLGLAICHSIVKKHDGHITVHSELQQGTVF